MGRLTKQEADRWHELLDIGAERSLSFTEEAEYLEFVEHVKRLDAEEGKVADAALDNLVERHERVIASIRNVTAAVKAAAQET